MEPWNDESGSKILIPIFEPLISSEGHNNVMTCLKTNWISSQGEFIEKFEKELSYIHGAASCAVTSSCTTALHLALLALEIGPGDEVICPDLTFIAPVNMVALTGATPVLCDVDKETYCITASSINPLITSKTKAIIVVHAFGHMAYMPEIMSLAEKHNIKVIEDVAEAPGSTIGDKLAGTFGDLACFSFFANKIFTSGEGSACLSTNNNLIEKIKILRDHGMRKTRRYYHEFMGFNYRMTNMQAALGVSQICKFNEIIEHRKSIEGLYIDGFKNNPNISYRKYADWCKGVFWLATITIPKTINRESVLKRLKIEGIECRQMVNPVHQAPPYKHLFKNHLKVSKVISDHSIHLPSSSKLTPETIVFITKKVTEVIDKISRDA